MLLALANVIELKIEEIWEEVSKTIEAMTTVLLQENEHMKAIKIEKVSRFPLPKSWGNHEENSRHYYTKMILTE